MDQYHHDRTCRNIASTVVNVGIVSGWRLIAQKKNVQSDVGETSLDDESPVVPSISGKFQGSNRQNMWWPLQERVKRLGSTGATVQLNH